MDDGSSVPPQLDPLSHRAIRLRHLINLGQGAALQTGIEYAEKVLNCDFYITMDADGQHQCEDLETLLRPTLEGQSDIVFGNRFLGASAWIPPLRKLVLQGGIFFERIVTGLKLGDSHNGYRAFNRKVAQAMRIQLNRMAHATEIKQIVAAHRFKYQEVPVKIIYTSETLAKGQRNLGALVILKDLLSAYLFKKTSGIP